MERLILSYVWKQRRIPVVLRRSGRGEKLRVRLPFADDNRQWLRNGRRTAPDWIGGTDTYWELPKSWLNDFADRALQRYGKVCIIQPYREQEICARVCQEAQGHECQCSSDSPLSRSLPQYRGCLVPLGHAAISYGGP